jgi:hypothetical protein
MDGKLRPVGSSKVLTNFPQLKRPLAFPTMIRLIREYVSCLYSLPKRHLPYFN